MLAPLIATIDRIASAHNPRYLGHNCSTADSLEPSHLATLTKRNPRTVTLCEFLSGRLRLKLEAVHTGKEPKPCLGLQPTGLHNVYRDLQGNGVN